MRVIALVTDESGWHCAQLCDAFAARACRTIKVSLPECGFVSEGCGLHLPGFDGALPDRVFVRGVPGGSLESVVFHLDVLHALQETGVPVYNDARMIERSVDKAMTSFLLRRAGVPTPPAWTVADREWAQDLVAHHVGEGGRLVLKPVFGSQGKGLRLVDRDHPLPEAGDEDRVYYLQEFVGNADGDSHDWRVFVVGGRVVAAMKRVSGNWINNVANGAKCRPVAPGAEMDELAALAETAVEAIGMFYAGVDLIRDRDGKLWVTEINSIPGWKGLQSVSSVNIAAAIADHFISPLFPGEGEEARVDQAAKPVPARNAG